MSADAGAVPAPGSDAAIKAGCTCYIMDISDVDDIRCWLIWNSDDCPVHDPLSDLTMRPRTGAGGAADADADAE